MIRKKKNDSIGKSANMKSGTNRYKNWQQHQSRWRRQRVLSGAPPFSLEVKYNLVKSVLNTHQSPWALTQMKTLPCRAVEESKPLLVRPSPCQVVLNWPGTPCWGQLLQSKPLFFHHQWHLPFPSQAPSSFSFSFSFSLEEKYLLINLKLMRVTHRLTQALSQVQLLCS